jgi:mannosyltransferase OCH1-like enzyme
MNIKIIHFIWYGKNMPENPYKWKMMNPDWEVMIWNRENMPKLINQRLCSLSFIQPDMQSDIARVEILYRYGGLYLDCDIVPLKPLGNFFEGYGDLVGVYENETIIPGIICNAVLASVKRHPVWVNIMKLYSKIEPPRWDTFVPGHIGGYYITPYLIKGGIQLLPSYYFYPEWCETKVRDPKPEDYPNSFGFHLWAKPNKLFNWK